MAQANRRSLLGGFDRRLKTAPRTPGASGLTRAGVTYGHAHINGISGLTADVGGVHFGPNVLLEKKGRRNSRTERAPVSRSQDWNCSHPAQQRGIETELTSGVRGANRRRWWADSSQLPVEGAWKRVCAGWGSSGPLLETPLQALPGSSDRSDNGPRRGVWGGGGVGIRPRCLGGGGSWGFQHK